MFKIIIIFAYVYFYISSPINDLKETVEESQNIILIGVEHPFYPLDDITIPNIADSLIKKSPYKFRSYKFSSGKEFIQILRKVSSRNNIGHLVIVGHSGYEGYFVRKNSGLYRDSYKIIQNNKIIPFGEDARFIKDIKFYVDSRKIKFSNNSIIIAAGCNTAMGNENFCADMCEATHTTVLGTLDKIDLYNVECVGEEMKCEQTENGFCVYSRSENNHITKWLIKQSQLKISDAIKLINENTTFK